MVSPIFMSTNKCKFVSKMQASREKNHTLVNPLYCSHFGQVQQLRTTNFIQKLLLQNQQLTRHSRMVLKQVIGKYFKNFSGGKGADSNLYENLP